jgi:hypothetical protein
VHDVIRPLAGHALSDLPGWRLVFGQKETRSAICASLVAWIAVEHTVEIGKKRERQVVVPVKIHSAAAILPWRRCFVESRHAAADRLPELVVRDTLPDQLLTNVSDSRWLEVLETTRSPRVARPAINRAPPRGQGLNEQIGR